MIETDSQQRELVRALAAGNRVSGRELAEQLGISRAAIWKRIERLRDQGLDLSAQAGAGYQLRHRIELLDGEAIAAALSTPARQRVSAIEVHWQLESTNSWLTRRAQSGDSAVVAVLAEIQTAGRGRRGRSWRSTIGGSLVLSLAWQFQAGMNALAGLSVVAGLALAKALAACGIDGVGVKWPNDAVVDGRKLAGILVEIGGEAQGPCHAVIGIGVNLRVDAATAATIDQDWTDLASLRPRGPSVSRNALAAALLSELVEALQRFERDGFAGFIDDHARYDVLRGREVRVIGAAGERHGVVLGVDVRGALRLQGVDGEFLVDSGEVSVRTT